MTPYTVHAKFTARNDPGLAVAARRLEALSTGHVTVDIRPWSGEALAVKVDGTAMLADSDVGRFEDAVRGVGRFAVGPAIAHFERGDDAGTLALGNPRATPDADRLAAADRFFAGIDWELLREQHTRLLYMAMTEAEDGTVEGEALDGVIALIDNFRDTAVDGFGYDEVAVFGEPADDPDEAMTLEDRLLKAVFGEPPAK